MEYTVDATNKSLGRVATEVASLLMGKNTTSFVRNATPNAKVTIVNASKITIPNQNKLLEKTYNSFSGYPGGLKQSTMAHVVSTKGYSEVLRQAVKGMLPKNRLQTTLMKNLKVSE
ncbi:MAG TPA: 50S ribosomal protein L13 [Candidatus Paceibacterota bacterium]|jgi:large subunit ribosomal protein L13|nr:50S ribosomal protein L13 [Candidatus Paceibacterota bacterium]